ncbi:hypothetical protein BB561_001729 [Smittium simulii]|uniref:BSD domain-containing protein n=1 Tax=Smittium simulii TaxID=133385 RepID=A0A2T9YTB4_9FUNG|nr:hypothetical protein BB561_001729 [Smittium simulii]
MWNDSQSIEHQSHTIFQKAEGILYCTNLNVAWVASGTSTPTLLIPMLHIKNQQVSTQEASRVKLRLLVKADSGQDSAYTFLWKENDKNIAKNDRDAFKNILAARMSRVRATQTQIKEYAFENQIQKGEDSSWLELAPAIQENGNFKYTITPEVARAIFKTYPQIKQAYIDSVPHKVSEGLFWKRFLSSQFFNRNNSKNLTVAKDDIFDKCMDDEDKFLSGGTVIDSDQLIPLFDLTRTEQDKTDTGNAPDITMKPGSNAENVSIIRRFNRYSTQIVSSTAEKTQTQIKEKNVAELNSSTIISDLQNNQENNELLLNLKDTDKYFATEKDSDINQGYDKQTLENILQNAKADISDINGILSVDGNNNPLGKAMNIISKQLHTERNEIMNAKKKGKFLNILKASNNKQKITQLYAESYELSRFMFGLLKPPLNQFKLKKAADIDSALSKYIEKLDMFISGLNPDQKQIVSAISERVRSVVNSARGAYDDFQHITNAVN